MGLFGRAWVLFFDGFHVSRRLRVIMRQGKYCVTFDRDFEGVIVGCAGRRRGRWHLTWITPRIMRAYARLYDEGHVHSFEVWKQGRRAGRRRRRLGDWPCLHHRIAILPRAECVEDRLRRARLASRQM